MWVGGRIWATNFLSPFWRMTRRHYYCQSFKTFMWKPFKNTLRTMSGFIKKGRFSGSARWRPSLNTRKISDGKHMIIHSIHLQMTDNEDHLRLSCKLHSSIKNGFFDGAWDDVLAQSAKVLPRQSIKHKWYCSQWFFTGLCQALSFYHFEFLRSGCAMWIEVFWLEFEDGVFKLLSGFWRLRRGLTQFLMVNWW